MYLALFSTLFDHTPTLFVYAMAPINKEFPEKLELCLRGSLSNHGGSKAGRSLEQTSVILLYHGPDNQPEQFILCLPCGMVVKCVNINPGKNPLYRRFLRGYAEIMEVARDALLRGCTPRQATRKVFAQALKAKLRNPGSYFPSRYSGVLEDMIHLQFSLAEDGYLYKED